MKKYILVKTSEEIQIGDTIGRKEKMTFSFGTIDIKKSLLITPESLKTLIASGTVKAVEETEEDCLEESLSKTIVNENNIGFYIKLLSNKYNKNPGKVIEWLEATNKICPKAVLDILLNEIALKFYNDNPSAFDEAEEYYSIRPKNGTVGKVTNINSYIPLFKSVDDAERARKILKSQLELMYGE